MVKHLERRLKKYIQWKLGFCFLHEKFLKSLCYIRSQNVSYSELKLSTFSLFKLFVESSQFLSGATKVSSKVRAVELTSMNNNIC